MKNLNLKLSKIFAFITSVFLILALASCSELFSDPEKTGSVSFSLSPEVARAIPSRSLAGYSFDKDIDFSLDDDDPNTYIFAVSLSGDYSETQYKSYTEAEFTSLGNDSTITFSEIPVGSKVKASVTLSIKDSTGTYPWYEGTSDSKEIVEGTNSLDIKITKKQYVCKFNVYIKGESDYELSSEYSKTLTGDLIAIDEKLVESLESLYEPLLQKGYILNEEKIDLWMPKLTGDSTLESSIYFDLPGSSEPGEDEPGEDEPEKDPTKLKFEFYLQGDDGNYAQSDDYPAVDFDITEDYDDEQLENLVKEKITEYALKIAIEGYTVNDEKTDASIEDMEIIDDCIVVKFYLDKDKAEDEPGEDEPGEDEPGEEPTKTVTVGGITVTLAETDTTDLAEKFEWQEPVISETGIKLAVQPKTVVDGYKYKWLLEGEPVDGATAQAYEFTDLSAGAYHVMLQITDKTGASPEYYSARTTFTVTAE